jgi:hypothetical protein
MVRDFGWNNAKCPIGQQITGYRDNLTPVVIGVVKNFQFYCFQQGNRTPNVQQFSSYLPYKIFCSHKTWRSVNSFSNIASFLEKNCS